MLRRLIAARQAKTASRKRPSPVIRMFFRRKKTFFDRQAIAVGLRCSVQTFLAGVCLASFASSNELSAQTGGGVIAGVVTDSWEGTPVPGVAVVLRGTTLGTTTDMSGRFRLEGVLGGNHILIFSKSGYTRSTIGNIRVVAGQTSNADLKMKPEFYEMEPFEVFSEPFLDQSVMLLSDRQSAAALTDAIGSDFFSQAGAGNAAEIMTKVTGASVVGGKYVFIRGLGERYGSTSLNGNDVPSADPDKKSVQLDIFPSEVIENVMTSKTFTPDQVGSFTGGSVNIVTKSFPDEFFFKFSTGGSVNTQSSFQDDFVTYKSGGVGLAGFAGSRALPAEWDSGGTETFAPADQRSKAAVAVVESKSASPAEKKAAVAEVQRLNSLLPPAMGVKRERSGMGGSFSISSGDTIELRGRKLGVVGSFGYDRGFSFNDDKRQGRFTATASGFKANLSLDEQTGTEDVAWSGLFNGAYELSENHILDFNFLYTRTSEDTATFQHGVNLNEDNVERQTLHFTERELQFYHCHGSHQFPQWRDIETEWNVSTSSTFQNEPDLRYIAYVVGANDSRKITQASEDVPKRTFRNVTEDNINFRWDTTVPFQQWSELDASFKFGYYLSQSDRNFQENAFSYLYFANTDITKIDLSQFASPENVRKIEGSGIFARDKISYYLTQSQRNEYVGVQTIEAGYGMIDLPLFEKWRFITGARAEATRLEIAVNKLANAGLPPKPSNIDEWHLLPAVSLVYELREDMNIRFAYGETIARPTFKEIADVDIEEFVNRRKFIGNPNLKMTTAQNYDIRWEWFPNPGEVLAASFFYKALANPIELRQISQDGQIRPENREEATLLGFEIEARKGLEFAHEALSDFSTGANFTYVESEVNTVPFEFEFGFEDTRPLVGQSPYIANLDLTYQNNRWGTTASLFYNVFGERVAFTVKDAPRVLEQPTHSLDFTLAQRLWQNWNLKFSAKNLLDAEHRLISKLGDEEAIYTSYRRGQAFSLSLSYEF